MLFRRANQRYGQTPEPVTPYQRAAQVWDERLGSARTQAKNWRAFAFGCLALSIGLAGGMIKLSSESRVTPYVVEVDKLGEAQAVGPAERDWTPTDAEIAWHLARFVQDVRALPLDPIIVRHNWLEAYDYASERAAATLNDFARQRDPFKAIGERTISVEVTSVVRASPDSFQIKWTEQAFRNGALERTERWTGIFSIVIRQPTTADALRKNPIGLFVAGLDWSRELNPGETP
jgi:type IV secretory pathway TrbF-like protein